MTNPTAQPVSGELREWLARAMYDAWPHTVISQRLHDVTGLPLGETLTWEVATRHGADMSGLYRYADAVIAILPLLKGNEGWPEDAQFQLGDHVSTPRKPFWQGRVCGWYRNGDGRLGFNVEADAIPGAIHNYPQTGLVAVAAVPEETEAFSQTRTA